MEAKNDSFLLEERGVYTVLIIVEAIRMNPVGLKNLDVRAFILIFFYKKRHATQKEEG